MSPSGDCAKGCIHCLFYKPSSYASRSIITMYFSAFRVRRNAVSLYLDTTLPCKITHGIVIPIVAVPLENTIPSTSLRALLFQFEHN